MLRELQSAFEDTGTGLGYAVGQVFQGLHYVVQELMYGLFRLVEVIF